MAGVIGSARALQHKGPQNDFLFMENRIFSLSYIMSIPMIEAFLADHKAKEEEISKQAAGDS